MILLNNPGRGWTLMSSKVTKETEQIKETKKLQMFWLIKPANSLFPLACMQVWKWDSESSTLCRFVHSYLNKASGSLFHGSLPLSALWRWAGDGSSFCGENKISKKSIQISLIFSVMWHYFSFTFLIHFSGFSPLPASLLCASRCQILSHHRPVEK